MRLLLQLTLLIIITHLVAKGQGNISKDLFNGENLEGWQKHGSDLWYVENGLLVCESGPNQEYGYLSTTQSYKDFELMVDFLQVSNGNSGIFFRSSIEGTKISGWQVEVAPPNNSTGGIYESYGRGWLIKPDIDKDSALKMGEWNTMKIKVVGSKVISWLNGVKMIELVDDIIGEADGRIALQIHDGGGIKIKWKNIRINIIK